jgi:putative sterol carrier protein
MTGDQLTGQKWICNNKTKDNIELVKNMIFSINSMSTLLYEVKAATPLGKTLHALLNLFIINYEEGKSCSNGAINLTAVSLCHLADFAGIGRGELDEALALLQRQGVIFYRISPERGKQ